MAFEAGRRLMIGFEGTEVDAEFHDRLAELRPGSVILFTRNLQSATQAQDLISAIRAAAPTPIVVAVDQEGGAVVRLTEGVTVFCGNMALGAAGRPELAELQGFESGRQLGALGFDLNLAPVVDLQTNPSNPGIGIRSFGASRSEVLSLAAGYVRGHARAGMACCLKHFPGKGAASVDAHLELPVLEEDLEEFYDPHLAIFADILAECQHDSTAVMSTHLLVRGLDPDRPATLSPSVMRGLLRDRLKFRGVTITDCLEMGAIVKNWGVAEAAFSAAGAGHDLIPISHSPDRQRAARKKLEEGLRSGDLDIEEHDAAWTRVKRLIRRAESTAGPVSTARGDEIARQTAKGALCLFEDRRGLIPIATDARVLFVSVMPHAIVGVEEESRNDWRGTLLRSAAAAGFQQVDLRLLNPEGPVDFGIEECRNYERVVMLGWDARGDGMMASRLELACGELADRLVLVHLRNPFDQALVPEGITAMTTFGYRQNQIDALMLALGGRIECRGVMPAPLVLG